MEKRKIISLDEVEKELNKIKKLSELRSKYISLVEEELKNNSIHSFAKSKSIKKMELAILETKKEN